MKRTKEPVRYHGISLPTSLIDLVRNHVKTHKEYRSIAEFTKEAIRQKLRDEK